MLATAPLFPPEAEFGVRLAEHGDVDVPVQQVPAEDDAGTADALERFVVEMDRLDFVGYNMLVNQWMLDWGIAWSEHECRELIDECQQVGVADRHEVINQNNSYWPTSAIRLVRSDERVRRALGFTDGPMGSPVTVG